MRAAGAALVAVLCVFASACGDGPSSGSTGSSSSSTTASTSSTASTTTGPTSTVPPTGGSLLTVDDSVLAAPADARPVKLAGGDPCSVLGRRHRCGTAGSITWVTDVGAAKGSPVTIYRVAHDTATPTLALEPGTRDDYGAIRIEAGDLDGRPGDELVVGLRNTGTGALLEVEIVGDQGTVLAHVTLDRGRAELDHGVLRTWSARYLPDDPNCCPSGYQEAVVGFGGSRWRSVPERDVPAAQVPKGDF